MMLIADLSGNGPASNVALLGKSVGPNQGPNTQYDQLADLSDYEAFVVEAKLPGGAGGTMQVGLQRSMDGGVSWSDYIRFPDVLTADATGAAAKRYSVSPSLSNTIVQVGDSATAFTIAANSCVGGPPGDRLRVLFVGQASVNAAIAYTIKLYGSRRNPR